VVIIGGTGTSDYTLDALLAIASLRHLGCTLPVELWHNGDERLTSLSAESARLLESAANVSIRAMGGRLSGYQYVGHALAHSRFDDILYLDADNVPITDPTPLFFLRQYESTGAVFWPDFTTVNRKAALWDIVDQGPLPMMSLESGQMLINRRKHWKALALAKYLIDRGPEFYFDLSHGECELLLFSWLFLSAPFHMTDTTVSSAGYIGDAGVFCGHTMLQFHPDRRDEAAFAHRNLMKWSLFPDDDQPRWTAIKLGHNMTQEMTRGVPHGFSKGISDSQWVVTDKCLCRDGRSKGCVDLDGEEDRSDASRANLARLAAIEKAILNWRRRLVDGRGQMHGEWQSAWLEILTKHGLPESRLSDPAGADGSSPSLNPDELKPDEL